MKIIRARNHYQHVAKSSVLKVAEIHRTSVSLFFVSPPLPFSLASQLPLISSFLLTLRKIFFHSHVSLLKGSSNNGNQNKPLSSGHNPGQVLSSLFRRVALETTSMLCSALCMSLCYSAAFVEKFHVTEQGLMYSGSFAVFIPYSLVTATLIIFILIFLLVILFVCLFMNFSQNLKLTCLKG